MSLRAICPECGTTATIEEYSHKSSVLCQKCGSSVPFPSVKAVVPPPLPKKPEPANAGFEVLDDEEELPDEPIRKSTVEELDDQGRPSVGRSSRKDRDRTSDDSEDEVVDIEEVSDIEEVEPEERPRRPAFTRPRDDDDEDEPTSQSRRKQEDDEDEDEPTPKSRRNRDNDEDEEEHSIPRRRPGDWDGDREPKGGKKGLLIVGLMLFLLLGAGGAFAVYKFVLDDEEPKLVANNDENDPEPEPEKPEPKIPDPKVPNPKNPDPKVPAVKVSKPRDLRLNPVKLASDRQSLPLPGKVMDVCAGAEGRFLFLHCAAEKKLVVYDVCQAGIVTEIPTAGNDTKFAAGIGKLFIADNATRTIQRFDLLSLEKDKEAKYPFEGIIKNFSLGAASSGPALVVMSVPTDSWPVFFLDQESLAPADVGWGKPVPPGLSRDLSVQASAYGTNWVAVQKTGKANELIFIGRDGKSVTAHTVDCPQSPGFAALSASGRYVYSRFGAAGTVRVAKNEPNPDATLFVAPGTSSQFYLEVGKNGERDYRAWVKNSDNPNFGEAIGIPQPYRSDSSLSPDRHLHYVPEAHAAIVLWRDATRLDTIRIDPLKGQDAIYVTSNPNLTFTPGKPLSYSIRTLTNLKDLKYRIIEAENINQSAGLSVSPTGELSWAVPADEKRAYVQIEIELTAGDRSLRQAFIAWNTAIPAPSSPKPKDPIVAKPKDPKPPDPKTPTNIAPGVKLVQEAGGKLPITPPMMTEPSIEVALPAAISDACVGGGGRYLIFHCPKARKLVVFDVNTLKVEKTITVISDDVLFAAGMNKLMLIYPDSKDVIRYDLTSFKLEANEVLEVRQRPTVAGMGSGVAGPLILGGIPSQNNASKMALTFIDPDTLKEILIEKAEGDFKVTFAAAAKMRVSANGATIGAWFELLQPTGLQIARLSGNTISGSYLGESMGHVAPGADGQKVFTEKGTFDNKAKPEGPRSSVVPASQGAGHIALTGSPGAKQQIVVWGSDTEKPINTFDDLPGFDGKRDPFERDNPNLALDRRLFYIPDAKILVVVPPAATKLLVYRVEPAKK